MTVKDVMDKCRTDVAKGEKISCDLVASRLVDIGIIYEMNVKDFFCALDYAKSIAMTQSIMKK